VYRTRYGFTPVAPLPALSSPPVTQPAAAASPVAATLRRKLRLLGRWSARRDVPRHATAGPVRPAGTETGFTLDPTFTRSRHPAV